MPPKAKADIAKKQKAVEDKTFWLKNKNKSKHVQTSPISDQYLITHFNDFQLSCLGSFFLHESVLFLSGLPYKFLERAGWLSKYKIQGHLHTYRFCDNVWTFILQDAVFKSDECRETVGHVKIVACDWKLLTQ